MSTSRTSNGLWREVVRQHRASGMTVAAFCRRAGVPPSSFYFWRRKLSEPSRFAEVTVVPEEGVNRGACADPTRASSEIELRLPGRRCIVVRRGFDRRTLQDLLATLETSVSVTAVLEADV